MARVSHQGRGIKPWQVQFAASIIALTGSDYAAFTACAERTRACNPDDIAADLALPSYRTGLAGCD